MSTSVSLYIRIRTADGRNPYVKPVFAANQRLRKGYALVDGRPEHHPEGTYHLRYVRTGKRVWESVGSEPAQALAKLAQRQKIQEAIAAGATVVEQGKTRQEPGRSLAWAVDEYLGDVSKYKARRTYEAYRFALEEFLKTCKKESAADVDRRDLFNFIDAMTDEGLSGRTKFNRVQNVLTFFRRQGLPPILHASEMPSYTEKLVAIYSRSELTALFEACTQDEHDLFQFFLGSGCRDNEVAHACWEDADFDHCTYSVRAKEEWKFYPKDHEEREIPISDFLLDLLRARRLRNPDTRLIFPRSDGKPNHHLLRILKEAALRTGLNCGRCHSGKGKTCQDHPVCGDWQLHSFRRTFATMHAAAGVKIHEISRWCGHASIETTQRYLATTAPRSQEVRRWVNRTFECFADGNASA